MSKKKHKQHKNKTMCQLTVYAATTGETLGDLQTAASGVNGWVIEETDSTYAAVVTCDEEPPSTISLTNSGSVTGVEPLVGGLIPTTPK